MAGSARLKNVLKRTLRRMGLHVRFARSRKYDLQEFSYDERWLRRFMHFVDLLRQIREIDGDIVECGVGPGRALFEFSVISAALDRPRRIYGFDTFEGLPDPAREDGAANARRGGIWRYSREHVRDALKLAGLDEGFVSSAITLVQGDFARTLPRYRERADRNGIAFLHIDADLYASYRTALECLYEDVVPGGIIAFDEYMDDAWPGATRAVDEFFANLPERVVKSPTSHQWYVVKE